MAGQQTAYSEQRERPRKEPTVVVRVPLALMEIVDSVRGDTSRGEALRRLVDAGLAAEAKFLARD